MIKPTLLNVISGTGPDSNGSYELVIRADFGGDHAEDAPFTLIAGDRSGLGGAVWDWLAANPDFEIAPYVAPPPADPVPITPQLYAVAQLTIANSEITGIDINSRFSAAMYFDVGLYYIFFAETQPDVNYLAKAYDDASTVRVSERAGDYIVVTATDANGVPTDPAEISIEIIRIG